MPHKPSGYCALILAAFALTAVDTARASIVPTSRFSYVTADTEVTDSETTDFANDYNDAMDYAPFSSAVSAVANAGIESCSGSGSQDSSMDAMTVAASGAASLALVQLAFAEGAGSAASSFTFTFEVDQAGIYDFSADVLGNGYGDYTLYSGVSFKGPSGTIAEISIDDVGSDEVPSMMVSLDPGAYSIEALAEIEIGSPDSEIGASFNVNLVYVSPEPGTLVLLGLGISAVLRRRRYQ